MRTIEARPHVPSLEEIRSNMTTYGTCHFVSLEAAWEYYSAYEQDPKRAVRTKLREGSIKLGAPPLKPGQRLSIIDNHTRYAITEAK